MKIGLVLEHYEGRNDVRRLVSELMNHHEIVIFASQSKLAHVSERCEKRPFVQSKRLSASLWSQLFNFFGKIPASEKNFLVTELFKLASLPRWRSRIAAARVRVRMLLPKWISFDFLVDRLVGVDKTIIEDIDRFLFVTEITSPHFLARVLAAGMPVDAYVYSWDHACKHTRMSKRIERWFVWHDGIADDLVRLQGIPRDRIFPVGSTQLAYVYQYLRSPDKRTPRRADRYIYYGCGVGHPAMASQEAILIEQVAEALQRTLPDVTLLVRPYPHLAATAFFRGLQARYNVEFDVDYRRGRTSLALSDDDIFARLNLQEHSLAFVHCGTTMGLEGAYLGSPVLFLDLRDVDFDVGRSPFHHLGQFIHQYHNEKYMMMPGFANVVRTKAELEHALGRVCDDRDEWLAYNREIAAGMPLRPISDIARDMAGRVAVDVDAAVTKSGQ